ncbi:MAG: pyridoxal-phosphate dependent enzyme, partial [Halobacteriaceae archaeon]
MTHITGLECMNCGATFAEQLMFAGCPECKTDDFRSNVAPTYDYDAIRSSITKEEIEQREGGVWAYPEFLPVDEKYANPIGEGNTPLVSLQTIGEQWGLSNLYVKDESQNPTWSYKDRLNSVAIANAVANDVDIVTISSTGNHGASTAAYTARNGLESVIFTIPDVPATIKTLMQVYGANVVATPTMHGRWEIMQTCIDKFDWYPTSNYNIPPVGSNFYGIEGYKSIAYEICVDLDWEVPDWIVQPVAQADGLSGVWRGFKDLHEIGFIDELPKMVAVERFGPLKNALENDLDHIEPVE